jgi:peptidoglycan hydrolase CwlO-like protein
MIASAIKQIVNTDRAGLKNFFSEVNKLNKTDEAVKAKIANNPTLAKALTDPSLTLEQKQQLAKALVSGVMVELGYTQAVNVKLVEKTNDNRAGHYGEDNNIYLNDAKINNTKDLATTIGHETSHAMDDQDQQEVLHILLLLNPPPCSYQSLHNPDYYAQQALCFFVFLLVCCLGFCC